MKVLEIILAVIFGIGLFFKSLHWPGGSLFVVVSLQILSMFYFLFSFILFNKIKVKKILTNDAYKNISPLKLIGTIGLGISLSTLLMGIMYKIQNWPGSIEILITGLVLTSIIFIISIIKYLKTKSKFYFPIFIRVFFWVVISVISLFINF